MSFSDRRRDGSEGRRLKKKYTPSGIICAEILRLDVLPVANQCLRHPLELIPSVAIFQTFQHIIRIIP